MLPKFRPATIGGSNRPQIRPVKPSAPPQPPRRHSSGIRNPPPESALPPTQANPGYGEPPTMAAARARIHEIARELPSDNRFGGSQQLRYEGETQGRIDDDALAQAHAAYDRQFGGPNPDSYQQPHHQDYPQQDAYDALPPLGGQHEEEPWPTNDPMTELRPQYDEALHRHEQRYGSDRPNNNAYASDRPVPADDNSGKYERREPSTYSSDRYDAAAYEANYPKAAPREERRGESYRRDNPPQSDEYRREEPRGSFRRDERDEPREERSSYEPPRAGRADETRAEGTGNRGRDRDANWSEPPAKEPEIPGPARIPQELRVPEGFVMGVQPIRTPSLNPQAFPPPQAVITPGRGATSYGAGAPGTMAATPAAMNQPIGAFGPMTAASMNPLMPVIPQPPPIGMQPMMPMMNQMHVRAHTSVRPGTAFGHQPQMTEVEEAQQGSKVGRFAWFVFGAAFGIFFAFAATGFGFGKKDEASFPPPAQLPAPTQTQVPQQPPPPVQPVVQQPAPMQQPVAMQPVPMQPVPMQQPVAMQPVPMQQPVAMQPAAQQPVPMQPMVMQPAAAPPATGVPMGVIAPPQAVAPAPVATQQPQIARPAAPVRRAAPPPRRSNPRPAPINNGDDDDAPAPTRRSAPASGSGDASDILGAGLGG